MKPQEVKADFIRLRASGYSYSVICEELHISKSTCVKWEKDNAEHIGELKRAAIAELCEQYGAAKEARVERLGRTLDRLNTAIEQADLSTIAPDKLLDLQLRYMDALKNEYTRLQPPAFAPEDATSGQAILSLSEICLTESAPEIFP